MSTAELKAKLIGEITDSNNDELLLEVYRLMELENNDIVLYVFDDSEKSIIFESQRQVKEGKFLSEEQANNEMEEWLGK